MTIFHCHDTFEGTEGRCYMFRPCHSGISKLHSGLALPVAAVASWPWKYTEFMFSIQKLFVPMSECLVHSGWGQIERLWLCAESCDFKVKEFGCFWILWPELFLIVHILNDMNIASQHSYFLECAARVPVSPLGVWGQSCVYQELRLCTQPFATVGNRLQLFAWMRGCCRSGFESVSNGVVTPQLY